MKLTFNIKLENNPEASLDLAVDVPDNYAKMGLESVKLAAAIKHGIDRIKEALDEQDKHD